MKIGILHHVALEEANEEGLDTEATLEEETTDEQASGEDQGSQETDPADEPIEYPEVGNLEVDKVAEQLAENEEERSAMVDDALDETEQLSAAIEAMQIVIAHEGKLSPAYAKKVNARLTSIRSRVGFAPRADQFALEGYANFNQAQSVVSLEDYKSTMMGILRTVIAAIRSALAWLKKAFVNYFIGIKHELAATKGYTDAILKLRGDEKTGKLARYRANAVLDDAHYVVLSDWKHLLTYKGKQPGEYVVPEYDDATRTSKTGDAFDTDWPFALRNTLELTKTHLKFPVLLSDELMGKLFEYCTQPISSQDAAQPAALPRIKVNHSQLIMAGWHQVKDAPPVKPVNGCVFIVNDYFLGSFRVVTRACTVPDNDFEGSLRTLTDWHTEIIVSNPPPMDGSMRFIGSAELKDASGVVVEIEHELLAYEKTIDKIQGVQDKLSKMAMKISEDLNAVPKDFLDGTSANGWRGGQLTTGLRAINNVISNVNRSLYSYSSRSRLTCVAWNRLLKQIYAKEKLMLAN